VLNALGAIATVWELGIDVASVVPGLARFEGIGRRFAEVGSYAVGAGEAMIVEDYGHHPSEIAATLEAARHGWPERRIVLVFQPHRYTRTRDLFDDFSDVLSRADQLIATDVYPAGEAVIDGFDARALCQSVRARGRIEPILVPDVDRLPAELPRMLEGGDLVLMMGAGSIGHVAQAIREQGLGEVERP
jgi:UDP-N-acetylmuramate--alanine ligase